jgi:hypothetical protein
MENLLRNAVRKKRQLLIDKLIKSGVYKKNNKHLYEWTLRDLEEEIKFIEANGLDGDLKTNHDGL